MSALYLPSSMSEEKKADIFKDITKDLSLDNLLGTWTWDISDDLLKLKEEFAQKCVEKITSEKKDGLAWKIIGEGVWLKNYLISKNVGDKFIDNITWWVLGSVLNIVDTKSLEIDGKTYNSIFEYLKPIKEKLDAVKTETELTALEKEILWWTNNTVDDTPDNNGNIDVVNWEIDFSNGNFTEKQRQNINFLIDTMKEQGITNPYTQVGILSCIAKESGFIPQSELSYSTTENNIIKQKFGTRISSYSDKQLTELKKDDEKFFDAIYNQYKKDPTTNKQKIPKEAQYTRETGNNDEGDGYTYRGRGYNGITFKSLYKQYGDLIGEDLVTNPDLLNDPEIAAKVALAFFKKGNKNNDLSDLTFTDKTTATKYFTDLNAWGKANSESYNNALAAADKFEVVEEQTA